MVCSVATAQIMLPAYQGVFAKQVVSSGGATNALNFDGTNDYIDLSTSSLLNFASNQNFSIEAWVKRKTGLGGEIVSRYNHGVSGQFTLKIESNGDVYFLREVDPYYLVCSNAISENIWHHIAATYDGTTMKIFVDGVLSGSMSSGSVSGTANTEKILIGARLELNSGANFFNGDMDEVRIWNVARTQAEIQANMNIELLGTETGLVAYYPFNQGVAGGDNTAISTVTDKTANAINGTLTNFTKNGSSSNFVVGKVTSSNVVKAPIISNGLVINLDANNATSYAGSGSTWYDISGNNNNGTLNNTVFTTTSGVSYFNFSSARVDAPIPKSASMTFSAWAKSSSFTNSMLFNTGNDWGGPDLFFYSGNSYWNVWDATGSPLGFSSASIDDHWHNYTIVNDASTGAVLYFDGVAVGSASYHASNYTSNLYIGAASPANDYGWVGGIASFQAYNRALSAAEVVQNFNAVKGNYELQTVQIGTQTWKAKNASVETYQNGDVIPEVTDAAAWNSLTTGAWCYYANSTANGTVYGKLYNWYAVHDPRNMAPVGWHVPTDAEYATLQTYLGGSAIAGGKLMSTGTSLWAASNASSTNSSGFSGLPGGYRLPNGGFNSGANWAVYWASDDNGGNPYDWQLRSNNTAFNHYPDAKTFGFSVRFIKDVPIYSSDIPTSGLVLNLDASNAASYAGSGSVWNDVSGNNNNGNLISGVTYSSIDGGTMVFDGSGNNRVQTNLNTAFTDFTVGIWYKDNGSQAYGRLMDKDFVNGFWLGRNGGAASSWGGGIQEPGDPYGIFITLQDAQWHFIVSVRSGSTHTIYGDGITNKATNTVGNAPLSSKSIAIGGWSDGGTASQVLTGSISQALVYNRALTEAEILQIFNATKAKYGL